MNIITDIKEVFTGHTPKAADLASVGAQYAYSRTRRHPSTKEHVVGIKNNTEIIDLEKSAEQLKAACAFAHKLGSEGKTLFLVGGKPEARSAIRAAGEQASLPWSARRWIGGSITNFGEIKKRINRLTHLREEREKGELSKYTKKERLLIDREIAKLELNFQGLLPLSGRLPDALFVVDSKEEDAAVREAKRIRIPVIALGSSDCDMGVADYPILGNDASRKSIELFVKTVVDAYISGRGTVKA